MMKAMSNTQQTNEQAAGDTRRDGARTVAPTRPRLRAHASRAKRRPQDGAAHGTLTAGHDARGASDAHWEEDGAPLPPEEWS
ncbi:hypothetical protein [Burkholderia multivorans]|uniref:hypothetical protein n=1 Tax=Burkholderia multivorans TaxID=87883 RepID=UPI0013DF9E98|nr:hypothetical protein [Burkholderia multivorans]MBU9621328.1 hypothetical protein [Burkholderia multivorans]NGM75552.1 hypothetical protein [Burkholderia multivorans]